MMSCHTGKRCSVENWETIVIHKIRPIWWQISLQWETGTKEERGHKKQSSLIQRFNHFQNSKCPFIDLLSMYFSPAPRQGKHKVYPFRFREGNKHYCRLVNSPSITLRTSSNLCPTHVKLRVLAETRRAKNLSTEHWNAVFWLSPSLTFRSSVYNRKPEMC